MADTETELAALRGTFQTPRAVCPRCRAHDDAMPSEALLRALVSEDWSPADGDFIPRPMNQRQAVAAELLTADLGRFIKAFGVETAGARLGAVLTVLRGQARRYRATQRTLEARADINARARKAWETGDVTLMRTIEDEPTPDYPGRERDERILGINHA